MRLPGNPGTDDAHIVVTIVVDSKGKPDKSNVDLVEEGRQKEEADGAAEPAHEVAGDGAGDALRVQQAVVQSRGVNVRAERSL